MGSDQIPQVWRFEALGNECDSGGLGLEIRYSIHHFHRYQETGEGRATSMLVDRSTGDPLAASNVVVLFVSHNCYSRTPEIIEIGLVGSGEGLVFRDGRAHTVS